MLEGMLISAPFYVSVQYPNQPIISDKHVKIEQRYGLTNLFASMKDLLYYCENQDFDIFSIS